jgi:ribosomal protein S18 acetylase RimI-like enzyme
MINIREYELLTMETGSYRDIELDMLRETLTAWKENPGKPYELIELRDGMVLAGFCLYYRSPNTDYTFDIHAFVIGRDYRNKAVGPRIIELLQERIAGQLPYAVMRIETSRVKETAIGDRFFESAGFQTIGHIPGFYAVDNDYYIYVRAVSAVKPEKQEPHTVSPASSGDASSGSIDEVSA